VQFSFDSRVEQFRTKVRAFLRDKLSPEMAASWRHSYAAHKPVAHMRRWMATLDERGWSVPHWPVEYGGTGWSPLQQFVFNEELALADAPPRNPQGTHLVGPIVYMFGSDAQKRQVLPAIRNGSAIWAQGFSEPGAGSDLAALKTRAERRGDRFVVNGQKIWTSGADHADWGFFLVRTDSSGKPQEGISFLLIPLNTTGITVRPIPQINGDAHVCEVFLTDVEVPAENLVGTAGLGWTYAKALLDLERTDSSFIYMSKREIRRLRELARHAATADRPPSVLAELCRRVARLDAEVTALEWCVLRVLAGEQRRVSNTAIASALKVRGAELQQAITELEVDLIGLQSVRHFDARAIAAWEPRADAFWYDEVPGRTFAALYTRAATVYGGSRQVQLNIVAKSAFGL
jgi:alkylation response protein AidB-like acyl-CoA dehydrogenase